MRKLIIWIVLVAALVAGIPAYYTYFGPKPTPPAPGESVALADGTKLNVVQLGPGPNVVLVHGSPGSAYDWGNLPKLLVEAGRHVVVYDRKGYGLSDRRRQGEPYSVDANAKELQQLLVALDLRDVTLVGWSYGGAVVQRAAALDADRIARLVLISSPGPSMETPKPSIVTRIAMSAPIRAWVARVPPLSERLVRSSSKRAFSNERPPPTWLPQMLATLSQPGVRDAQLAESQALDMSVLKPEEIQRPVLVIHGSDDRLVPFSVAEDLHARIQGSELLRIDDASHMLPITDSPKLAKRIAAFAAPAKP
jgi:pimeloyl-ACP methyl ester carboxylesterase